MTHIPLTVTTRQHVAIALAALAMASTAPGQCTEGCTAIHRLLGEANGDQFGWVSNAVGDVTGDGTTDFLVTAPNHDANGSNSGRLYLYDGVDGSLVWTADGDAFGWWLGHHATAVDDITGDGNPDIIAGAPFATTGRARLYDGVTGSVIHTFTGETPNDQFGFSTSGGGDFNGDGVPDVLVTAPASSAAGAGSGRAYIFSTADFSLLCSIDGPGAGYSFGTTSAFVGDISVPPDGCDDVVIGASAAPGGGRAYVYQWSGSRCQQRFELSASPGPAAMFGHFFANGGLDVNRDGTPDIYVSDFAANRAHIFSGVDGTRIHSLSGDGNGQFGIGRIIGDVDGDHHADMLLAAWISSLGALNAGKAFVYSGRTGQVLETFTHGVANSGFGFDANGMGDVNGDGRADHLITAASWSNSRGKVFVIAGTVDFTPWAGIAAPYDTVDVFDLLELLNNWGTGGPGASIAEPTNVVDVFDLLELLANWSGA